MTSSDLSTRRRAREAALRMLYQTEVGRAGAYEAIATYWPAHDSAGEVPEPLREFANSLVRGTLDRVKEIDTILTAHAQNWRIERMAVIDRLVLRLAVFELLAEPNTPPRVVINEALELARSYSGEEAVAFVNGVLDAVRKELKRE
jgi:N utilization substance protein B